MEDIYIEKYNKTFRSLSNKKAIYLNDDIFLKCFSLDDKETADNEYEIHKKVLLIDKIKFPKIIDYYIQKYKINFQFKSI